MQQCVGKETLEKRSHEEGWEIHVRAVEFEQRKAGTAFGLFHLL